MQRMRRFRSPRGERRAICKTMIRALFLVFLSSCSCSSSGSSPPSQEAPQPVTKQPKDPAAAKKLIASGAAVLDVRTADEFASGHIADAVNIPVAELGQRMGEVAALVKTDKAAPIVVYCASGRRSTQAQQELSAAGYSHVVNGGGFVDLQ